MTPLHTGSGVIPGSAYVSTGGRGALRAEGGALRWGRLPVAGEAPVATVASG